MGDWHPALLVSYLHPSAGAGQRGAEPSDDGDDWSCKSPLDTTRGLAAIAEVLRTKATAAAMSRFRRSLPGHVDKLAGLTAHGFRDPLQAARVLIARRGWTHEDYRRVAAIVTDVPLCSAVLDRTAVDAVRAGARVGDTLGRAFGLDGPLCRKALASLSGGALRRRFPHTAANARHAHALARMLDAAFRAEPHAPALGRREADAAWTLVRSDLLWAVPARHQAAALLAHRRKAGGMANKSEADAANLRDMWEWLVATALAAATGLVMEGEAHDASDADAALAADAVAASLFHRDRRWESLLDMSLRWHATIGRLSEALAGLQGDDGPYPHPLAASTGLLDVAFDPLLSARELAAEGLAMHHCVGGRAPMARTGGAMVMALSSPEGRSTAEVCPRHGGGWSVVQHRGPRNADPPARHAKALAVLVRCLPEWDAAGRGPPAARDAVPVGDAWRESVADRTFEALRPWLRGVPRTSTRCDWLAGLRGR